MNLNHLLGLIFSFFLPFLSLAAIESEWAPDSFIVGAQKSGTTAMYVQPYNEELDELFNMKFNWNKS